MRLQLTAALLAFIGIFAVGLAQAQHQGHQAHNQHGSVVTDTRILVKFPPMMIEHTLANMRDHLQALQEITQSLAQGQYDQAAKIAEGRLGMSSLSLHGAHNIAQFMPPGMRDAGTAMHRAASRFAIESQNASVTGDSKSALAALGEVMSACVGCHAGYRLK